MARTPAEYVAGVRHRGRRLLEGSRRLAEAARRTSADQAGAPAPSAAPPAASSVYSDFFDMLCVDGSADHAMVATTRRLIAEKAPGRARSIAQTLQNYAQLRPAADICVALCAIGEPMPKTAWALFTRNDLALVMRFAPGEYFRVGFIEDPGVAAASLSRVLRREVDLETDSGTWLAIAEHSFAAGYEDLSAGAVDRAEEQLPRMTDASRVPVLTARIATMRQWFGRAAAAAAAGAAPDGEIPFALVDHKHLDWRWSSQRLTDTTETLTVLGHLARHEGVSFAGDDPELVAAAGRVASAARSRGGVRSESSTVRLYPVNRDFSRYAAVPSGTWIVISDWFTHPAVPGRFDIPLNDNLRPIFVSFHTDVDELAAPGAVEYLKRYAPIGCLDWDTVFLLQAAGIPAFFTGALASTVDTVVAPRSGDGAGRTLVFDLPADGVGARRTLRHPATRDRSLGANLDFATELLVSHQDGNSAIVTRDLQWYAAARALGFDATLKPEDATQGPVVDHDGIAESDFAAIQHGLRAKLEAVLGAIVAGRGEDDVYAVWRAVCAEDVSAAEAALHNVPDHPRLSFDLNDVCDTIRAARVVVERSEPGPSGSELNVEFSLDANYKHQLDIVLDSIVTHASRPIRAFVLCRQHGAEDFERMARLFPTVSFVWLPTDDVDYGRISGMNRWVTPATMDRTALPLLLPEIDRILHFDLDALCLADLAELYDVDMKGMAIAGAAEPQPNYASGFETFRRSARRLRREGTPDKAREFIIRTHSEFPFDFTIFNAGIMVLDLEKMRADDFTGKYLPYVQAYGINGQVVVNAYVGGNRVEVGGAWNRLMRLEMPEDVKIAHWAGPYKPWRYHHYVTGREHWREAEDRFWARTAALQPAPADISG